MVTICQSGTDAGIDWEKGAESKLQSMGQLVCGTPTKIEMT